jgi:hypothetical protein
MYAKESVCMKKRMLPRRLQKRSKLVWSIGLAVACTAGKLFGLLCFLEIEWAGGEC